MTGESGPGVPTPTRTSLFGDALVYTLSNVAAAAIPFLMLPIVTRVLTPHEYGVVAMFFVVVAFVAPLTGLSVSGAVAMRYFDRDEVNFPSYVATCLCILVASTAAVLGLVWIAMPLIEEVTKVPGSWIGVAVLVASAQFVVQVKLAIWQSSKRPWRYGGLRLFQAGIDAVASLMLVLAAGLAWQGRVGGMAIAVLATALLAVVLLRRGGCLRFAFSRTYAAHALRFGIPLMPHTLGGLLTSIVDRLLISNFIDLASTGVYMVAMQIGMVLGLLADSFNRAFAPWLMESLRINDARRDVAVVRFTYAYFVGVLGLSALVGFAAPASLHCSSATGSPLPHRLSSTACLDTPSAACTTW